MTRAAAGQAGLDGRAEHALVRGDRDRCSWTGSLPDRSAPYDHADITAALANRVVLEALSAIARERRDEDEGTTWDPRQPSLFDREPPRG